MMSLSMKLNAQKNALMRTESQLNALKFALMKMGRSLIVLRSQLSATMRMEKSLIAQKKVLRLLMKKKHQKNNLEAYKFAVLIQIIK